MKTTIRKPTRLITRITALFNSMKLWAMPHRATQNRWVMVESSDKMWSTGEGNGNPVFLVWEPDEQYEKATRYDIERWTPQVPNMLLEKSGEITPERMKRWRQNENNVTGDGSKVCCCKEHYCIETWNVRSMNEGELEVLKQEMARVNIDHLGISELKWTRMGEFNSDDHCVYYCGQEYFRRNGVALIISKRVWNTVLGSSLKNDRMISVRSHISCQLNQFNSGVNIFSLKKDLNTAFKVVVVVVWSLCPLDSFLPHSLQHTRLPCSSVSPRVCSDSCPLSQWCYLTISSSATAFSSCAQFPPASEPF